MRSFLMNICKKNKIHQNFEYFSCWKAFTIKDTGSYTSNARFKALTFISALSPLFKLPCDNDAIINFEFDEIASINKSSFEFDVDSMVMYFEVLGSSRMRSKMI